MAKILRWQLAPNAITIRSTFKWWLKKNCCAKMQIWPTIKGAQHVEVLEHRYILHPSPRHWSLVVVSQWKLWVRWIMCSRNLFDLCNRWKWFWFYNKVLDDSYFLINTIFIVCVCVIYHTASYNMCPFSYIHDFWPVTIK